MGIIYLVWGVGYMLIGLFWDGVCGWRNNNYFDARTGLGTAIWNVPAPLNPAHTFKGVSNSVLLAIAFIIQGIGFIYTYARLDEYKKQMEDNLVATLWTTWAFSDPFIFLVLASLAGASNTIVFVNIAVLGVVLAYLQVSNEAVNSVKTRARQDADALETTDRWWHAEGWFMATFVFLWIAAIDIVYFATGTLNASLSLPLIGFFVFFPLFVYLVLHFTILGFTNTQKPWDPVAKEWWFHVAKFLMLVSTTIATFVYTSPSCL